MTTDPTRSLLIVDDEEDLRSLLVGYLKELSIELISVPNGIEALDVLRSRPVSAVLCDLKMPGKDGIQLLTEVRALPLNVPFVFLTGFSSTDQLTQALRLGATDFLDKPVGRKELVEVVARALEIGFKQQQVSGLLRDLAEQSNEMTRRSLARIDEKHKQASLLRVVNNQKQKGKGHTEE